MEKEQVLLLKDSYLKESTRPDGSKSTVAESFSCTMDNGLVFATAKDCVVFDDEHELAHAIYVNNDMKTQATYPISIMSVSYGVISEVESLLSKENFKKILDEGFLSSISEDKKKFLIAWADHIRNHAQQPIDVEPAYPENPDIHDAYNRKLDRNTVFESTAKIIGGAGDPVFYPTLAEAISNLKDGQTIKLTNDTTIDATIIMDSPVKATVDLGGHTIATDAATLFNVKAGELVVKNGDIKTEGEVFRVNGTAEGANPVVTVGEDVTISSGDLACFIIGNATFNSAATIENTGVYCPIMGNGLHQYDGTTINLTGGKIIAKEADAAIYHPQVGTLNISNTEIVAMTPIYQKGGTINITSGKLHANGAKHPYEFYTGCVATGDAIVVDTAYDRELVLNISGGEFISDNSSSVTVYNKAGELNPEGYKDHVNITGGVFKNEDEIKEYLTDEYTTSKVKNGYVVYKK